MNNTETPTMQKVAIPLRLPQELYRAMMELVHKRKRDVRGYSVNQYLTELLEAELKESADLK